MNFVLYRFILVVKKFCDLIYFYFLCVCVVMKLILYKIIYVFIGVFMENYFVCVLWMFEL